MLFFYFPIFPSLGILLQGMKESYNYDNIKIIIVSFFIPYKKRIREKLFLLFKRENNLKRYGKNLLHFSIFLFSKSRFSSK